MSTIMITAERRTNYCYDVDTAADLIFAITGDENDYKRMLHIIGNMKDHEMFHGDGFVIQCFEE